ncbi:hypothetical protein ACU6U9_18785 [Pseudomonas sp. HK3]
MTAKTILIFGFFLAANSSLSYEKNSLEVVYQLQKLKIKVRNTYAYSLIVDHDLRAHDQMVLNLDHVLTLTQQLIKSKQIESMLGVELMASVNAFSQSSSMPTIQYFQSSGTGTTSKGYEIYFDLVQKIDRAISTSTSIQKMDASTSNAFEVIDIVMASIEMHAERALASSRSELFSEAFIARACDEVRHKLLDMAQVKHDSASYAKIKRHWTFIEKKICNPLNAKAPFSIVYFGGLMVLELEDLSNLNTLKSPKITVNE